MRGNITITKGKIDKELYERLREKAVEIYKYKFQSQE